MPLPGFCSPGKATQTDGFGILYRCMITGLNLIERGPMTLRRRASVLFCLFALTLLVCAATPLRAQAPRPVTFLAEHYDVSATLDAIGQSISATAKIDFKATEASSSVRVELHPNLIVKEVKGPDGKPLTFQRDNQNPLIVITQLASPGGHGRPCNAHLHLRGSAFQ